MAMEKSNRTNTFVQPVILKLLVTWLNNCPNAVHCFLDSRLHLTYLLELVSSEYASVCTRGLASVLLGECTLYNNSSEHGNDSFSIVDAIRQKIGLTAYLLKFDEMQRSNVFSASKMRGPCKPLTRSNASSMVDFEDMDDGDSHDKSNKDNPFLSFMFDGTFVEFIEGLDEKIRESIVEVYSHPKSDVAVVPAELERKDVESDKDYIERLKSFMEKQCTKIQGLLGRNATLAEELAKSGGGNKTRVTEVSESVQSDGLRRDLQEALQRLELLKAGKAKLESEASTYRNMAAKAESDLKSLSDAYNSLEQSNYNLERELKALWRGDSASAVAVDIVAAKAQAREEAQKESEAELNDLLVCLGQEQSKVEKLSARLVELGEDVDKLLEGIGDEMGTPGDEEED